MSEKHKPAQAAQAATELGVDWPSVPRPRHKRRSHVSVAGDRVPDPAAGGDRSS
jgi:hypothetical protein